MGRAKQRPDAVRSIVRRFWRRDNTRPCVYLTGVVSPVVTCYLLLLRSLRADVRVLGTPIDCNNADVTRPSD